MDPNADPWEKQETKKKKEVEKKKKPTEEKQEKEAKEKNLSALAVVGFVFAFLFAPLGLILSLIALHRIKKNSNLRGRALALAGFILSIIFTALSIAVSIIALSLLDQAILLRNTFG